MDVVSWSRWALPAVAVFFLAGLLVWPLVRVHRTTGVVAFTLFRRGEPEERLIAEILAIVLTSMAAFVTLFALRGPTSVGAWTPPAGIAALGLALAVAGAAWIAVAQKQMGASLRMGIDDRPTALVREGVFGWVRNPIYTGLVAVLAGVMLVVPSLFTGSVLAIAVATVATQARLEERHLTGLHGDAYLDYAARVGRFVPGVGRLRPPDGRR